MRIKLVGVYVGAVCLACSACTSGSLSPAGCERDDNCAAGYICDHGTCVLECASDRDCDDGNVCTTDVCDPKLGCVSRANDASCDDGNPCTEADACEEGACVAGPAAPQGASCDTDGLENTREICLEALCVASVCGDGYVDDGVSPSEECDDGNFVDGDGCESDCTIIPPELSITFPTRGATLDGSALVTVAGTARDATLGLASVTINGVSVQVGADGHFEHVVEATTGLNPIEAVATNTGGKRTRRTVGFYWSPEYAAAGDSAADAEELLGGVSMRLSQDVIDDGDHPCGYDQGEYVCSEIDDIATLAEIVLNNLDLSASLGSVPVYESTTNFVTQEYPFGPYTNVLGLPLSLAGNIDVIGDVILTSEITELDLNALTMALTSRAGGLNSRIEVGPHDGRDGVVMSVRTTAQLDVSARFDVNTLSLIYDETYNSLPVICGLLTLLGYGQELAVICPQGEPPQVAPLGRISPAAHADSGLNVERMTMRSGFDIVAAPEGGVEVHLVSGNAQFHDSDIAVEPIRDMMIDLGDLEVLGMAFDLGEIPLGDVVSGLDALMAAAAEALLNDLQPVAEVAMSLLLFNEDDPLSVGSIIELGIEQLAFDDTLNIAAFAGQQGPTAVEAGSVISAIELSAPVSGEPFSGGMILSLDTSFSSDRAVEREPLGSLMHAVCWEEAPAPAFPQASSLEMADHVDAVNQLLFAAWWAGGFDFRIATEHLSPSSPVSDEAFDFALTFHAAPLLNRCEAESWQMQVADVAISGTVGRGTARRAFDAFLSVSAPVQPVISDGALALERTDEAPRIVAEVLGAGADAALANRIEELTTAVLLDEVLVPYCGLAMTAIPAFEWDLQALSGEPAGSVLRLEPATTGGDVAHVLVSGGAGAR